jgi:hypothetical protein
MRHRTFSVIVALLMLGLDDRQYAQGLRAAVELHNRARLPNYLISDAQEIVSQIYSRSGVDLIWFRASRKPSSIPVDDVKIRIIILSKDAANSIAPPPDAVGFTPSADGRHGRLAYILGHRVFDVSRGYHFQPAIVLAGAIAHEIGHMFLSRGHTPRGLMRAQYNQSDFRRLETGELQFTSIEAADIRRAFAKSVIDLRASADPSKR